jgi:hypothetical protein
VVKIPFNPKRSVGQCDQRYQAMLHKTQQISFLGIRAAGQLKPATGAAPVIPCTQVFYSPGHPAINQFRKFKKSRAQKNRKHSGVRQARLLEVSSSEN